MAEENVSLDLIFTDINEALQDCQSYVTSYCDDSGEANESLLTTALKKKNKAIEACDKAGEFGETETTDDELTKICTIKDIYVLAYFIMSQYFTNQEIINKFKERFLGLQYDGEEEFKSKIKKITYDIASVPGFGQANLTANVTATAAPTLSPPAAAPTLSPTAADVIPTTSNARDLLNEALRKLYSLTPNNYKLQNLKIDNNDNDEYHKRYMGFGMKVSFMVYIKEPNIFEKVKEFIAKITYKGKIRDTYVFTLHDIVGYATPVSKLNNNSESLELSDYCKARDVFIKILQFIKEQYEIQNINVDFVYPPLSGLKKSSTTCNPVYGKANMPLSSVQPGQIWSQIISIAAGGGSKSRRRHRRHAHKTRRGRGRGRGRIRKSKVKTHRRRCHSRVRKHKKNTYTRRR
jgi:hypothetical protein